MLLFIPIPKKSNAKDCPNYHTIAFISTCQQSNTQNSPSKTSTTRELRTSRYSSWIQKRQRNQRSNCQHPLDNKKKQENSRKTSTFASLTMLKPLTVWVDHNELWKILQEMGIPDHLNCLLRNLCANQEATVRMLHGTMNWFKIGKGVQSCILSSCLLTYMQSTSCEMLGWMHHKLESRLLGEISISLDMQMTPPLWQKAKN